MILTQSCSIHNCILSRSFYYELLGALRTLVVCLRISKRKSNGGSLLCALPSEQGTGDLRGQSLQPESDSDLLWFTLILSWFRLCKSPAQCIQEDILPLCSSWCFSTKLSYLTTFDHWLPSTCLPHMPLPWWRSHCSHPQAKNFRNCAWICHPITLHVYARISPITGACSFLGLRPTHRNLVEISVWVMTRCVKSLCLLACCTI